MNKLKQNRFLQQVWVRYFLVALVLAVLLPLIFGWLGISKTWRVGLLFMLINGCAAFMIGYRIQKTRAPWYHILYLPVLFALMVVVRYADYNYWFVPIYFLLSYLGINTAYERRK
ncbi:hypothetical protein [Latilactobacillus fuchuensis]|uniref:Integral membrane protein n=2 Tax=Latilactobacillus fuchuensis TaxID=164393 RepID=A0A2N9DUQ8_9LACO|nr:hypothetical protein [Latilactobacillus fuchuensis]KRL61450.1 hypothetical protein FC69_GL000667 [Latilactobacillus fuchuensis DSM 14340 = JCM 11249]SPC37950.1 conserved membrane hypothetical protein [Latilactobacillus fuchuensis]